MAETSIRETVLAAMMTKLGGLSNWPLVRRNWPGRVDAVQCPAALLFDGGEEARDEVSCQIQIDMPVEIDVVCRAASTDQIGPELSARIAEIKALFLADHTLGGLVSRVVYQSCADPVLDEQSGGSPMLAATLTFGVVFEHSETSPYRR